MFTKFPCLWHKQIFGHIDGFGKKFDGSKFLSCLLTGKILKGVTERDEFKIIFTSVEYLIIKWLNKA